MAIPSLKLFRHTNSVLSIRLTVRKLCVKPTLKKVRITTNVPPDFQKLAESGEVEAEKFSDLRLDPCFTDLLKSKGFRYMSPLQQAAIPKLLNGRNACIMAETGSGKTLSYLISIINTLNTKEWRKNKYDGFVLKPSVVILTPSSGNGEAIHEQIKAIATLPLDQLEANVSSSTDFLKKFFNFRSTYEFGGGKGNSTPYSATSSPTLSSPTPDSPQRDCDIFISSPMRFQEKLKERTLSVKELKMLVLDDVGRFDTPMITAVKWLKIKAVVQIVLTGVGFTNYLFVRHLFPKWNMLNIFHAQSLTAPKAISQRFQLAKGAPLSASRLKTLILELKKLNGRRGIIFCQKIEVAKCLESELYHGGFQTVPYHSHLHVNDRHKALAEFKNKKSQILVCTAMASCINFSDVDFVINYELPVDKLTYLHQIGRCGRMGQPGTAVTFATQQDVLDSNYLPLLFKANDLLLPDDFGEECVARIEAVQQQKGKLLHQKEA